MKFKLEILGNPKAPGLDTCNGCAVCTLSCPVWRQSSDLLMTFCGRVRSAQGGAELADLAASLDACVLCGSCEPVCAYGMETVPRSIALRAEAGSADAPLMGTPHRGSRTANGRVVLVSTMLRPRGELRQGIMNMLGPGISEFDDNGEDISAAMELGSSISEGRVDAFLASIKTASEVVTMDGLLLRLIKKMLPSCNAIGLGDSLIKHSELPKKLRPDDLYVIDSRAYHADYKKMVVIYDKLRNDTGCMMNLDMHRVATPTGASSLRKSTVVDPVEQAKWILEGRPATRVIVERLEDIEVFRAAGISNVIFVSEV